MGFPQLWLYFRFIQSEKFIWMQHTFYINMKCRNLQYQKDRLLELLISFFLSRKKLFFRYFSIKFIKCLWNVASFILIRSCAHLQENSSGRKVKQLSHPCLHTDSRRLCWGVSASGRLPSSALLGRSDKAGGWTDKTEGNEDQQGCSSCLPSTAGPCKYCCCGTALCIRSIVKSGGASMEYQKQFWYHFAIWSHQGYRLPMEDLSRFIKNCVFFLLALNVSLSMGHGNTCCMRKTEGPTSTWRKFLASKAEQKNFLHLLNHLQKREYSWELCYLCDWSLVNSRQQNELSRVAEYQIIVGCLD